MHSLQEWVLSIYVYNAPKKNMVLDSLDKAA